MEKNNIAGHFEIEKRAIDKNKVAGHFERKEIKEDVNEDIFKISFFDWEIIKCN